MFGKCRNYLVNALSHVLKVCHFSPSGRIISVSSGVSHISFLRIFISFGVINSSFYIGLNIISYIQSYLRNIYNLSNYNMELSSSQEFFKLRLFPLTTLSGTSVESYVSYILLNERKKYPHFYASLH